MRQGLVWRLDTFGAQDPAHTLTRHADRAGQIDLSHALERRPRHALVQLGARRALPITGSLHQRFRLGLGELDAGPRGGEIRQRGGDGSKWITWHVGTLTSATAGQGGFMPQVANRGLPLGGMRGLRSPDRATERPRVSANSTRGLDPLRGGNHV